MTKKYNYKKSKHQKSSDGILSATKKGLNKLYSKLRRQPLDIKTSFFISCVAILSLIAFITVAISSGFIPFPYLFGIILIVVILFGVLEFFMFKKKITKIPRAIAQTLNILLCMGLAVITFYANALNNFFDEIQVGENDKVTYTIFAKWNDPYSQVLYDIERHGSVIFQNNEDTEAAIGALKNSSGYNFKPVKINSAYLAFMNVRWFMDKIFYSSIDEGHVQLLKKELAGRDETIDNRTKPFYAYEVDLPSYHNESDKNPTNEPFIVYFSVIGQYDDVNNIIADSIVGKNWGADQTIKNTTVGEYNGLENVRGISEINKLIVVNPKTHKVLLLDTPSEYYVQRAGTRETKDKLSSAGIYGIGTSIETLEDFYDIDIDYYFRTTFYDLAEFVDTIGGIDINSDRSFTSEFNPDIYIQKGDNHFDGKTMLAYAQENAAYNRNGRRKGVAQQQIIDGIMNKITSTDVFWTNFNPVLMVAGETFDTDMPSSAMKELLRAQLMDKISWQIEEYAVNGTYEAHPINSLGNDAIDSSVMIPDENTVNEAKSKIQAILNG